MTRRSTPRPAGAPGSPRARAPRLGALLACSAALGALAAAGAPLLTRPLAAQAPAAQPGQPAPVAFERYQLANGLTVLLAPDRSAQVVSVNVWYDVGSRDERPGRTGFAHLFEHMMFQGSANVKKGEHFQLVERAGGSMNGTTSDDRTNYFQTLPSNRLNLGLWLEADRMRSLDVSKENLDNQRKAVQEEKRLRVDNQPYAGAFQDALTSVFDANRCFAYAHTTIGTMADLDAASVDDVRDFFRTYYAPNNATLTVVGDFDPAEAKRLIQQYFGDIPRAEAKRPVACEQAYDVGEQRKTFTDPKATLPAVVGMWRIPEYRHADTPALTFLATILGGGLAGGESSRLNRAVARDARAAVGVQALAGVGPRRGPNVFVVLGIANQGVPADSVERLLLAEVAKVAEQGVTEAELAKAKNAYRAQRINELQTSMGRAEALQQAALFLGDPAAVNTDLQRFTAVTTADIQRVARTYLRPQNLTAARIVPEAPKP